MQMAAVNAVHIRQIRHLLENNLVMWCAAKRSAADKKASAKKGNTGSAPKADYSKEADAGDLQVEQVPQARLYMTASHIGNPANF